jgi:hypothetical protein
MGTVNFSVPDDVKEAFNEAFAGENKSAVLTQLMRDAVARVQEQRQRQGAAQRILGRLARAPVRSSAELAKARRAARP